MAQRQPAPVSRAPGQKLRIGGKRHVLELHRGADITRDSVGQILQVERTHRPLETDVQLIHFAFRQGDDVNAYKPHSLLKAGDVLLVARQSVKRFRQDEIEATLEPIRDQLLNAGSQERRSGNRSVGVAVNDLPTFAVSASAAQPKLILNRGVALIIRRITGVKRDLHETASLFTEAFAGCALPFRVDELLCSLSRKQADKCDEARVALCGVVSLRTFG